MFSQSELQTFINLEVEAMLTVKFSSFDILGCTIPSPLLRLVKYEEKFDIDFTFDEDDLGIVNLKEFLQILHERVSHLGARYQVKDWFCGIEPASDLHTRLFSHNETGPIRL